MSESPTKSGSEVPVVSATPTIATDAISSAVVEIKAVAPPAVTAAISGATSLDSSVKAASLPAAAKAEDNNDICLMFEGRSLETARGNPKALFKVFRKQSASGSETLTLLYTSESVSEKSPKWQAATGYWYVPLMANPELEVLVEVWDQNLLTESVIGSFTTTIGDLTKQSGHGVLHEGKLRGSIFVEACSRSQISLGASHHLAAASSQLESGQKKSDQDSWFSPPVEVKKAAEGQSIVSFNRAGFLKVCLFGVSYSFDILSIISNLLISFVVLFVAWLVLGSSMEPGGNVFSPIVTIFAGAVLGLLVSRVTGCPPLVGMLLAGVLWGNLPNSFARNTDPAVSSFLRNIAVAVILTRAGLTFKWSLTKPVLKNVALMSCLPQLTECLTHAFVAFQLFPFPNFALALYQGAAIASCSTAIVIPGVVEMQSRGYGVTRGPPILMLCTIALDSVFAIWFTSFVIEFGFPDEAHGIPVWLRLLAAPLQILGGALIGLVAGLLESWLFGHLHERIAAAAETHRETVEKTVRMKCLAMTVASGIGLIFGSYKLGFPGSGTVAVVLKAGFVAYRWGTPELDSRRIGLYHDCADLWDTLIVPSLFTIVGASIDLSAFADPNLLLRALACIGSGLLLKSVMCFLVTRGIGYSTSEKVFLAVGWCAKSTVQAATAGKALVHALEMANSGYATGDPAKQAFIDAAIQSSKMTNLIVVSSIALCAVSAGVGMRSLGPKLLIRESVPVDAKAPAH